MRRWALVAAGVAAVLLAVVVGLAVNLRDPSCVALTLVVTEGDAPALDEEAVRREAPQLAALLDEAVAEGHATEEHAPAARAMHAYLARAADGGDRVSWRGTTLRAALDAC